MTDYKEIMSSVDMSNYEIKAKPQEKEVDIGATILEQNFINNKILQQIQNQGAIQLALITLIAEKCGVNVDQLAKDLKKKMEDNKPKESKT